MPTSLSGFQSPYNPMSGFAPATPSYWNSSMFNQAPSPLIGDISAGATAGAGIATPSRGWLYDSGFLGSKDADGVSTEGWGMPTLGAVQGLFDGFVGLKQLGLYKDQLSEGKRQFGLNYDAQRSTTNAQLQDRQAARVASNPGAYQSVGDYMNQYGIKPATGG